MSVLVERVVRVNGEERQRSQVVAEYTRVEKITLPVATIVPPLLSEAKIEIELTFDPPLTVPRAAKSPTQEGGGDRG